MAAWYSVISLILHIVVLVYFIYAAIAFQQIREAGGSANLSVGAATTLYVISIILAVLSGVSALLAIVRLFRGNNLNHPAEGFDNKNKLCNVNGTVYSDGTVYPNNTYVGGPAYPNNTYVGGNTYPNNTYVDGSSYPANAYVNRQALNPNTYTTTM